MLFPLTFEPKTDMGRPIIGDSFCCVSNLASAFPPPRRRQAVWINRHIRSYATAALSLMSFNPPN